MNILPELEAYRDRLVARTAAWPETSDEELSRDLAQCEAQVGLLERALSDLRRQLADAPPADAQRLGKRIQVQDQLRDLTAAYAEVLRIQLRRRSS